MNDRPGDEIIRPTKERMRKSIGHDEVVETTPGGLTRKNGAVRLVRHLDDLWKKGLVSDEEREAGYKFHIDHELAGYSPRVTMDYRRMLGGTDRGQPDLDAAERREFHRKRWHQACKVLEEIKCRKAMHWFLIEDIKLENIGSKFWGYGGQRASTASARATVSIALYRLARFYGLVK
jgi:hypothetical protein